MQPNSPYSPGPPQTPPHPPEYGFIMEPEKPPRPSMVPKLPTNASLPVRIALAAGGLLVLIVIFTVIKGLFAGNSNIPALVNVAQDQQELIHLTTNPGQPQDGGGQPVTMSITNQNAAITTQLSMTSAQSQLVTYLKKNGKKVNTKTLGLKISATTDQQLTTAVTNSTFDQTFQEVLQDKLKSYQQDLRQAYNQTSGVKGRKLLSSDYNGAGLLLDQLNSPAS